MTKVVGFLHNYLALGGSDRVTATTSKLFAEQGICSVLFSQRWEEAEFPLPDAELSEVSLLPHKKKIFAQENVARLIAEIKRCGVEKLFICCSIKSIPRALREETNCEFIFWDHSMPLARLITHREKAYNRRHKSLLYSLRWYLLEQLIYDWTGLERRKYLKRYRRLFDDVDQWLVLCPEYKEEYIKILKLTEQEAEKIKVIYNTLEVNPSPSLEKKKEIVYLGRLTLSDKRVDRLLYVWQKCMQELPDWSFKVYGNGKAKGELMRLADELSLERFSFEDFVLDTQAVYDRASVLCLPSNVESWGLVLTEAQNNAVVPIAFACSAGVEFILSQGAGVLVPKYDLDYFTRELIRLAKDDDYRRKCQEACLEKRFDYSATKNEATWRIVLR